MTYDIHIRTADGFVQYPNAFSYGVKEGILRVQVGDDLEHADDIYFSPTYWWQYAVDPHSEDPLDLDLLDDDDDEDEDLLDDDDLADHEGE